MKDYVKYFNELDKKSLRDFERFIQNNAENGSYPKSFKFPVSLQFELTSKCNLKCAHCYNLSGEFGSEDLVTPEKWIEISREIVEAGGIFQCILSGGEPLLLGENIFPIMDILHNDGTAFVLISNGTLFSNDILNKLKKYRFFWTQISIDGHSKEIHDKFRAKQGTWEKAIDAAFKLSENGFPLVIAHSVFPENLHHLEKMGELAYQLGASSLILGEVIPSGRAFKNPEILMNKDQKNEMYRVMEKLQNKYIGKMDVQRTASVKYQIGRNKILPNIGAIIRPNGDLRLDCMAPFTIGNVLEIPIRELWQNFGKNCWENKNIQRYFESLDEESNESDFIKNYLDKDCSLGE